MLWGLKGRSRRCRICICLCGSFGGGWGISAQIDLGNYLGALPDPCLGGCRREAKDAALLNYYLCIVYHQAFSDLYGDVGV